MIYWLHIRLINLFSILLLYLHIIIVSQLHFLFILLHLFLFCHLHFLFILLPLFYYSFSTHLIAFSLNGTVSNFVKRLSFEAETFSFSKKKFLSSFCVFVRPLQTNFQLVEVAGKPKTFHIGPQTKSASPISFGSFISSVQSGGV